MSDAGQTGRRASTYVLDKARLFDAGRRRPALARHIESPPARLKAFQDVAAADRILAHLAARHPAGDGGPAPRLADIGGDQSRVIGLLREVRPDLACAIVDSWDESIGNGTVTPPELEGVELIHCLLGPQSAGLIPAASFDVVTSISVVEHVPEAALEGFFAESLRICRPGGLIAHYIDLHLSDRPVSRRGSATVAAAAAALGAPLAEPDWRFRAGHVSNPDSMMFRWGIRSDNLSMRAERQAVCLVIEIELPGETGA